MKVAVLGGGITGCSCAWQIFQMTKGSVSVSIFEMGRGAGGRAATRRSRDLPGLAVSHGAPLFHHTHSNTVPAELLESLESAKAIRVWNGTSGKLNAGNGDFADGPASRGEAEGGNCAFTRYVGSPGMSAVADGILKLAGSDSVQTVYGTRVNGIKPRMGEAGEFTWELLDANEKTLGEYDWLVMTSASAAHPRWRSTFGEDPPMYAAAEALGRPELTSALERLKALTFEGLHAVMLAWHVPEGDEDSHVVRLLKKLPSDILVVEGDDVLAKIVRQTVEPPYATIVLHSTSAMSDSYSQVYGSTGTAARMGASAGSAEQESEVADKLYNAFKKLLADKFDVQELPAASFGPTLHRWGTAFPKLDTPEPTSVAWTLPTARVSLAGDYLAPPFACVETAMTSGISAAQGLVRLQAAKQYVDLANRHDRAGLLAMLAVPCDMFGEPASKEGMDWYFDTYDDVHFEITLDYAISASLERAVEFGYTRSWRSGSKRLQLDVHEVFTFAQNSALIERIAYIKPPSEPVEVAENDSKKLRSDL